MSDEKRPSLREAARRGVEAKPPAQAPPAAAPPAAAPPAAAAPPQKPKPPVVGVEQVMVRCGHIVPFELFDLKKDKFRSGRRKKLTDRDCSECRKKAQEVRQAAEMEAARKRRQERPKTERPPPKGRLPHGSRYDVTYDAAKGVWAGTLTVPAAAPGAEVRTFVGEKSALFRLLTALDEMYRAAVPAVSALDENRDEGGEG